MQCSISCFVWHMHTYLDFGVRWLEVPPSNGTSL